MCFFLIFLSVWMLAMFSGCGKKTDGEVSTGDYIADTGFWKNIKARDYIEMFNYKALVIPKDIHTVSDGDLQNEISNILSDYAVETKITDQAVKDGDTVNIDYVGSIDGVEFEGGSTGGGGTNVIAGSSNYIDDFLTQIIGHMPGETVDVRVKFPEDYGKEELNGKDALFVTVINYIAVSTDPDLTDDFVASNFSADYGWNNVSEMKEGTRNELRENAIRQYIRTYFTTEVKIKVVPDRLIEYQENTMIEYYKNYADMYGMELNDFLNSFVGVADSDALVEQYQDSNLEEAKYLLVTQAIAEDMGLTVSDNDLTAYFLKYTGSSDYATYIDQYGLPYLKHVVLNQMVLDYVVANAVLG